MKYIGKNVQHVEDYTYYIYIGHYVEIYPMTHFWVIAPDSLFCTVFD